MKQVQKNSFISYVLSDQVWWCNIKRFWVILKITSANLCKAIYDIINYSTFICPFESGKCGKEGKKLQKFEHLEKENSFLDEIKNIFLSFWRPIIWWKKRNLIKIADTSFNLNWYIHIRIIFVSTGWLKCLYGFLFIPFRWERRLRVKVLQLIWYGDQ